MMAHNGRPARILAKHDGEAIRLQTNLGRLDSCELPAVFAALGQHLGLDPEPLRKAVGPIDSGQPDPRYPELTTLIRAARRDWVRWGGQLVEEIAKLLEQDKLLPMTPANENLLLELFADHEVKLVLRFSGHVVDPKEFKRLVKQGLVSPNVASASYIDTAWKLGRGLDMLHIESMKIKRGEPPDIAAVVRQAVAYELTPEDEEAIDYVKRRGAIFMRRTAQYATSEAARVLNEEEYRVIRHAIAEGLEQRWSSKRIAQALNAAVQGSDSLQNDMDRVARTELAFAHAHGAYTALKAQASEAGEHDPWVFKLTSSGACVDCKRIWGPPSNPKRYHLSEVEARDAAGGNFRRPRREWGPTIGPTHPHCTEGPLMYYHPTVQAAIDKLAADYESFFGS